MIKIPIRNLFLYADDSLPTWEKIVLNGAN